MKADYWRKGVATILTASLLAVGAIAQEGAEGEVTIEEQAPAVTSEAQPAAQPAAKPVKPQIVDRDPFVNQLLTGTISSATAPTRARSRTLKPKSGTSAVAAAESSVSGGTTELTDEAEAVEIPAPQVSINGIVSSGSGNQAIISTDVGTRMISEGQKLGDYSVSRISDRAVVFTYGGEKEFTVEMADEFSQ